MRCVIVINPRAGVGRARRLGREIVARLGGAEVGFWEGDVSPGLRDRCRATGLSGPAIVVAVGGDGTVNRILNALGATQVPLGIVPAGTANDLAGALGVPRDLETACAVLRGGRARAIDLVEVNGTRFATCGGTDLAASVAARAERWRRGPGRAWWGRLLGRRRYTLAALQEVARGAPRRVSFVDTSGALRAVDAVAILGSNQPRFGGRFCASPGASNDDGWLDLCVIPRPRGTAGWIRLARCAWRGALWSVPGAEQIRTREAIVRTAEPVRFLGDGEILAAGTTFSLRLLPRAATFLVPARDGGA